VLKYILLIDRAPAGRPVMEKIGISRSLTESVCARRAAGHGEDRHQPIFDRIGVRPQGGRSWRNAWVPGGQPGVEKIDVSRFSMGAASADL
jgi:hypothetical protein